ncbi:C40 family peptidase [Cyanobium sp. HWJ4-Hawea]|uniref:C40 family peptidase n=1 Tax=Cyanobium sp. HWJ4-Hawea TaxID=2823713 RepID=UPI0020CFAA5B|nr:C40 family peptidase [Cyanobium sp. HWJ4-Hawea]MCP9808267.1 C40 family peptidase [Cyanobium sp. HWJ4-Hawea]
MPLGSPAAPEWLRAGTIWRLLGPINLFSRPRGSSLATQAWAGRHLLVLEGPAPQAMATAAISRRLPVRLLDDGYPGWIEVDALLGQAISAQRPKNQLLDRSAIAKRLDGVVAWALAAQQKANSYLWGGSLGPDFDCSGLLQSAYASQGIWIPRDAYLQERFCQPVAVRPGVSQLMLPGDLIFFGTPHHCTHVGLHLGQGAYLHSSGSSNGHNGLAIDNLAPQNSNPVACHYRESLRGAGRVMRCHDGTALP